MGVYTGLPTPVKVVSPPLSTVKFATTMVPGAPGYEEHIKGLEEVQRMRIGDKLTGILDSFFNWINSILK